MVLRRVGVLSAGKVVGLLYAVLGLIFGLIFGVGFIITAALGGMIGQESGAAAGSPVLYGESCLSSFLRSSTGSLALLVE
jgi:hypothetical protein